MPPSTESAGSEPLLYKIDYTTIVPQDASPFCKMPDEILLRIAKYLFAGIGLEFWNQTDKVSGIVIRAAKGFDTNGLKVLRLCKLVKQKLMPLLVTEMSPTLQISNAYTNPFLQLDKAWKSRLVSCMSLSPRFSAAITRLEICATAVFLPHPAALKNLSQITISMWGFTQLESKDKDDDARVLQACRQGIEHDLLELSRLVKLAEVAKEPPGGGVQVIAAQRTVISRSGIPWKCVHHDIAAGIIVKKVEPKSSAPLMLASGPRRVRH